MKTRTATIYVSDILFDVNAATHLFASVNDSKDFRRFDALESDAEDATNLAMLSRFAEGRVAELKRLLSRFLTSASTTASANSQLSLSSTSFAFSFYVEDGFQDELLSPIAKEIESFIATGVIADWYNSAGEAIGKSYEQKLPPIYAGIISHFVKRKFPTRS